ncbi:MAG: lipid A export permease/ATP-binding protein MsbA [Rubrivivax sp.]|nr:lipid A export permease/ATP-binding protein MsbA [Rubrivivax sp.]
MASLLQRFARVAPYFKRSRPAIGVAVLGSLVAASTEPMLPALMQPLLDKGFAGPGFPLWWIPAAFISLFLVRGLAGFVAQYALSSAATRGILELRRAMFAHLMRAEPGLFTRQSASHLTNTVVYEVQQGTNQLVYALLMGTKDLLTLVALLVYLLWLNWKLTLMVAVLFPLIAFVMQRIGKRLHRLTVAGQDATDDLAYVVEENALAWRIVRLHGAEAAQSGRLFTAAEKLRRLWLKSTIASATITPLTQLLAAVVLSSVITVALWQSTSGTTTVGGFVAFVTAMLMLVGPIKHLSDVMTPITRGLAALERGVALIDEVPAESGGTHRVARARGEISFHGAGLQYPQAQSPALDAVDLQVAAGEVVALVGPSGAGKSSLVHLLPRFIEPTQGEIRLDGVPLAQWDLACLRGQFALVSQDVVLFNDSIAANVSLGAHGADPAVRDRVRAALRSAHLLEFAEGLPQGLETLVGHNGSQLSGGQRQRLAIARALFKDAPILILDEATSALDSESERAVQSALEDLMKGRTTLVIAHRLSTIEHADRVVALEAGRVAEQGTHAELLALGGVYARLHAMQFRS